LQQTDELIRSVIIVSSHILQSNVSCDCIRQPMHHSLCCHVIIIIHVA